MKKKKTINILGYTYSIEYPGDVRTMNATGRVRFDGFRIQLANSEPQELLSTMLHECLECLNRHLNLDLEEDTIVRLEVGLFQVLTQNGVDLTPLLEELDVRVI